MRIAVPFIEELTREDRGQLTVYLRQLGVRCRRSTAPAPTRTRSLTAMSDLRLEISAEPHGCTLVFTHAGWRAETPYFVMCHTTWGALMFRIKAAAEGRGRGQLFLENAFAD